MGTIENKLKAMGYTLPPPFTFPKNNRTGCTQIGNLPDLSLTSDLVAFIRAIK
jgi:hypothetical protein